MVPIQIYPININTNFGCYGAQMVPGTTKLSYEYIRGNMRQIGQKEMRSTAVLRHLAPKYFYLR